MVLRQYGRIGIQIVAAGSGCEQADIVSNGIRDLYGRENPVSLVRTGKDCTFIILHEQFLDTHAEVEVPLAALETVARNGGDPACPVLHKVAVRTSLRFKSHYHPLVPAQDRTGFSVKEEQGFIQVRLSWIDRYEGRGRIECVPIIVDRGIGTSHILTVVPSDPSVKRHVVIQVRIVIPVRPDPELQVGRVERDRLFDQVPAVLLPCHVGLHAEYPFRIRADGRG